MEQAFRLLKEKMKAQGYLVTTSARSAKTAAAEGEDPRQELAPNMNELSVAILNCANVKAATAGEKHSPPLRKEFPDRSV